MNFLKEYAQQYSLEKCHNNTLGRMFEDEKNKTNSDFIISVTLTQTLHGKSSAYFEQFCQLFMQQCLTLYSGNFGLNKPYSLTYAV